MDIACFGLFHDSEIRIGDNIKITIQSQNSEILKKFYNNCQIKCNESSKILWHNLIKKEISFRYVVDGRILIKSIFTFKNNEYAIRETNLDITKEVCLGDYEIFKESVFNRQENIGKNSVYFIYYTNQNKINIQKFLKNCGKVLCSTFLVNSIPVYKIVSLKKYYG